jgi:hypothetical protein
MGFPDPDLKFGFTDPDPPFFNKTIIKADLFKLIPSTCNFHGHLVFVMIWPAAGHSHIVQADLDP